MKVLMLGWEYPPHISGGLGTACEGLTTALAKLGVEIDFVVPRLFGGEKAPHMQLVGAAGPSPAGAAAQPPASAAAQPPGSSAARSGPIGDDPSVATDPSLAVPDDSGGPGQVRTIAVPSLLKPYLSEATYKELLETGALTADSDLESAAGELGGDALRSLPGSDLPFAQAHAAGHYGSDLFLEVARYAMAAAYRVNGLKYDLVHAHDWMTFPAGLEVARQVGAPLLIHVHSLEYDRAAEGADRQIVAIERGGLDGSDRVIAVSYYTRSLINRIHGTSLEKIEVVHNGVYAPEAVRAWESLRRTAGPVVLFLGRVTFQKGPEYFVQAARKVLEHVPDAVFVMAGSGDMLPRMKQLVVELGIEDSFRFPGFVRGEELERTFSTADVYVMPSVSEPFGIAPLEAMSYDRPVIVSKQSGVSEVLRHALKVDFWDVDKMASQIVALLELPELKRVIVERAREEIRNIHWDAAAEKLLPIYESVSGGGA